MLRRISISGLINLFLILMFGAIAVFLYQYVLMRSFVEPAEEILAAFLSANASRATIELLAYPLGLIIFVAVVFLLGALSVYQCFSRLVRRFPWLLKIPILGIIIGGVLIKIFEIKIGLHVHYLVEVEDLRFLPIGRRVAIVTNEYKEDGVTYCNIYLPTSMSIWTGETLRKIPKTGLKPLKGGLREITIFITSFGASDPFINKSEEE